MYTLKDTLNDCVVSRHRTIEAAIRAGEKLNRAVKRRNGRNSYIPTRIEIRGELVPEEDMIEAFRYL